MKEFFDKLIKIQFYSTRYNPIRDFFKLIDALDLLNKFNFISGYNTQKGINYYCIKSNQWYTFTLNKEIISHIHYYIMSLHYFKTGSLLKLSENAGYYPRYDYDVLWDFFTQRSVDKNHYIWYNKKITKKNYDRLVLGLLISMVFDHYEPEILYSIMHDSIFEDHIAREEKYE